MEYIEKTDLEFLEKVKGHKNIINLEDYHVSTLSTATKCAD